MEGLTTVCNGLSSALGAVMKVRPVKDIAEKRLRNLVFAYLQGEPSCDLRWVEGCIGPDRADVREILVTHFAQYASTDRYRELMKLL